MMGEPSSRFFSDDDMMADALTLYYTDYEPESCFVAECQGKTVGYLTGAKNTQRADEVFFKKILWRLAGKSLRRGIFLCSKNWQLFGQIFRALCDGRLAVPDIVKDYPATLHINVLPEARGSGAGTNLMAAYLRLLSDAKISGVRMATMSEKAGVFFEKNGFSILYRSTRPYFRHIIGKDVPLLIYAKRLSV